MQPGVLNKKRPDLPVLIAQPKPEDHPSRRLNPAHSQDRQLEEMQPKD